MSSFWNFFGGKDENEKSPEEEQREQKQQQQQPGPLGKQASQPPQNRAEQAASQQQRIPGQLPDPKGVTPPGSPKQTPRYGIDDAIKLMRTLPVDENVDLVVRVIKRTLESLDVKVPDIVDDAKKRQENLRAKIGEYQAA